MLQMLICNAKSVSCEYATGVCSKSQRICSQRTSPLSKEEVVWRNLAFLKQNIKAPWRGKERPAEKKIPGSTVSQAEWCENPIEFPARQVYSPASSKVTFRKYRISSSLSVVLTPAVYRGKKTHTYRKEGKQRISHIPSKCEDTTGKFQKQIKVVWFLLFSNGPSSTFIYSFPSATCSQKQKKFPSPGSYSVPLKKHASKGIQMKNCPHNMTDFRLVGWVQGWGKKGGKREEERQKERRKEGRGSGERLKCWSEEYTNILVH